jgi:ABC-type bacteriocin/lantibiotic exporter with double-glycine peptidase domain
MRFYNLEVESERETARLVGTNKQYGSTAGQLASYLRKRGLNAKITRRTTIDQVCMATQKNPVLILYQKTNRKIQWNAGHWAVVVGCSKNHLIIVDPSSLKRQTKLSKRAFIRRWYDFNGKTPAYGVAIFVKTTKNDIIRTD